MMFWTSQTNKHEKQLAAKGFKLNAGSGDGELPDNYRFKLDSGKEVIDLQLLWKRDGKRAAKFRLMERACCLCDHNRSVWKMQHNQYFQRNRCQLQLPMSFNENGTLFER